MVPGHRSHREGNDRAIALPLLLIMLGSPLTSGPALVGIKCVVMGYAPLTSYRAAAQLLGVSSTMVSGWARAGYLGEPPWTRRELRAAAKAATAARTGHGRPATAEHGTASRWRRGCDCDLCRVARNSAERARRAATRDGFWADATGPLLHAVAAGTGYAQAVHEAGATVQAVTARRHQDPVFAAQLDAALISGRDPGLPHGSAAAWKNRCRCPECRDYHEAHRRP